MDTLYDSAAKSSYKTILKVKDGVHHDTWKKDKPAYFKFVKEFIERWMEK